MNKAKTKANIYIIAKEAGVSVATVSRFFNRKNLVKESTRGKILKVCKKYSYEPSRIASAITTKKTKTIALLVPSLKEPAFIQLIGGVESIVSKDGYCLSIFNARQSIEKELEIAKIIDNRFIDGVIFSGVFGNEKEKAFILEMQKREIPCIMVDRIIPDINIPYIASNDYLGGKIAAKFLLGNNHKRIGIISYDTKVYIFRQRVKGFIDTLNENGLMEEFVLEVPLEYGKIEKYINSYRNKILEKKPSAIFTTSDSIAIFLMSLLMEKGIKVPDEVSIMGYDNMIFSRFSFPRLTTIHHDMFELGKVVGENLISKLENGKYLNRVQVIDPKLLPRDSVIKI